ncbi:MAG TPA: class I SAM-dependent methyltransferase [Gammaproteobacteria bacterium]
MSGFAAEWLAQREAADRAARSALPPVEAVGANREHDALDVVDLGAGTGANLRFLGPWIARRQRWTLADDDPHLLALARSATAEWAAAHGIAVEDAGGESAPGFVLRGPELECRVATVAVDLAHVVAPELPRGSLVTASALLDLVSERWLRALAARCAKAKAAVLFALTYDGRIDLEPADDGDARLRALVNRHQRRDKGFGPALGPSAPAAALDCFAGEGYVMSSSRSDWRLGPEHAALQRALVDGWLSAAREAAPDEADALDRWQRRRHADLAAGRLRIVVGHTDVAGYLP